ncbi:hypothetical protein [Halococcus saccharolyticus]|uniref:hypothetical protein n=1 Tax=Halococcus saccharolyticus TaxID=62319 RepID=UPI0009B5AE45|nr:hypothetical protein [Halococcus saccharolyticus]
MDLLFRVLVGVFVCVAPTVLFLGLWNGLQRMQDGELVERVARHQGATVEDLVPGTRSGRTHDLDSRERRILERAVADGTSPSEPTPDDERSG